MPTLKTPKQKAYAIFCISFFSLALAIHATFTAFDLIDISSTIPKYLGVLLCFAGAAFQFYFFRHDGAILLISSFITCIADLFLLVLVINDIGVFVFIFAQLTYFARIYLVKNKFPTLSLLLRLLLFVALSIILNSLKSFNFLTAVTAFYFINLIFNAVESATLITYDKRFILFTVGLILFICCDICVGISNLNSVLGTKIPNDIKDLSFFAIWQFYMPSQLLIILSANQNKFTVFDKGFIKKRYEK
ncbi:MAG: hypothetical protein E7370_02610 [Clostridiales bacterium]|nr:hypothetical protein [Clostridiales bacterium]